MLVCILWVCFLGVNGWFPLVTCSSGYITLPSEEHSVTHSNCVGGIEISINFSSTEDRTAVLQSGVKLGWLPSLRGVGIDSQTGDIVSTWKTGSQFEIHVEGGLLPVESVTIPTSIKEKYKLCYVRYKFYDRGKLLFVFILRVTVLYI